MKKRLAFISLLLLLILPTRAAGNLFPVTRVSFDELPDLVLGQSPDVLAVKNSYSKMELQLFHVQTSHEELMDSGALLGALSAAAAPLQHEMEGLKSNLRYKETDIARVARQQLYLAGRRYIAHYGLAAEAAAAQLVLDGAEQELARLQRRYTAGYCARRDVEAARETVRAFTDALRPLQKARDDNLTALADLLGIAGHVLPKGLPEFDFSAIPGRGTPADLAGYMEYAPGVQAKKLELEQAERAFYQYHTSQTAANRYAVQRAQEACKAARSAAERDFPAFYRQLSDAYDSYRTAPLLRAAEENYERCGRMFERGLISAGEYEKAGRELASAQLAQEQRAADLSVMLLTYEYYTGHAVQPGDL